jgi:hypothetical protein
MSTSDDEQARLAQAQAQMEEAAVIDAGTKAIGKDPLMDSYQTILEKIGPAQMRGFNNAALAHDDIAEIYTRYASDSARLDRLTKLPYGRAVVDMSRVESGVSTPTSHEPAWAAKAKSGFLTKEEFHSPLGDRLNEKDWQRHHEKYDLKPRGGRR